jgi:capsular polysaccharide biosynthesis protein
MLKQYEYSSDDYWAALYRRRRIIALVVLLSAIFSALFSFLLTPLYEATMQFYIPQDIVQNRGITQRGLIRSPGLREQVRPYVAVLESRDAHEAVASQLENRTSRDILRSADFDVTPAASIVIYVRDKDPAVAKQIVELFFEYFLSFHSLRLNDTVKVLEKPSVDPNPVFPVAMLNFMVGAVGGLLLGIIYALFLDYLDLRNLTRRLKQIEGHTWFEQSVDHERERRESL